MNSSSLPLCVDLDGTLVTTDTLIESALQLIKANPLMLFYCIAWLFHGKARLKFEIGKRVQLDAAALPYNAEFLNHLKKEHAAGRRLILATATDSTIANAVSSHVGIFQDVIASDGKTNVSASLKAQAIETLLGNHQFIYAGNSRADIPVWQRAAGAVVVHANHRTLKQAEKVTKVERVFPSEPFTVRTILKQIRVHQWIKNILLFVPIITAHEITNSHILWQGVIAFIAFSATASSIYVLNDLLDLESDRKHATKKFRPLASGRLSIPAGIGTWLLLLVIGIATSLLLPFSFLQLLLAYVAINIGYSFFLKQVPLIDVIVLASLYTLRILAGSAATAITTSSWLFLFALFLFLSLALLKRFTEVFALGKQAKQKVHGRGYSQADKQPLSTLGMTSGYLSLLVLALYISSDSVAPLYNHPLALWTLLPLLLYWISRIWLLAHRGEMHDDPIVFALTDKTSYIIGTSSLAIVLLAT